MTTPKTYNKFDRIKVEDAQGKIVTVTVAAYIANHNSYKVVTSTGQKLTVNASRVKGLA